LTLILFLLFLVCSTLLFLLLLACLMLTLFNIVDFCLLDIELLDTITFLVAPYLLDVTRRYCSSSCYSLFNVDAPLATLKIKIWNNKTYNNWYMKITFENKLV
jgi:hypothetical protein